MISRLLESVVRKRRKEESKVLRDAMHEVEASRKVRRDVEHEVQIARAQERRVRRQQRIHRQRMDNFIDLLIPDLGGLSADLADALDTLVQGEDGRNGS